MTKHGRAVNNEGLKYYKWKGKLFKEKLSELRDPDSLIWWVTLNMFVDNKTEQQNLLTRLVQNAVMKTLNPLEQIVLLLRMQTDKLKSFLSVEVYLSPKHPNTRPSVKATQPPEWMSAKYIQTEGFFMMQLHFAF